MDSEVLMLVAAGVVMLVALLAALLAIRTARRAMTLAERARVDGERLAASLEAAEARAAQGAPAVASAQSTERFDAVVITDAGTDATTRLDRRPVPIDGPRFADTVARESVIKAAGLAAGLRRALDPQTRNRIRFEMRREVKRSRKQRRADHKAALRAMQARERAAQAPYDVGEEGAA